MEMRPDSLARAFGSSLSSMLESDLSINLAQSIGAGFRHAWSQLGWVAVGSGSEHLLASLSPGLPCSCMLQLCQPRTGSKGFGVKSAIVMSVLSATGSSLVCFHLVDIASTRMLHGLLQGEVGGGHDSKPHSVFGLVFLDRAAQFRL